MTIEINIAEWIVKVIIFIVILYSMTILYEFIVKLRISILIKRLRKKRYKESKEKPKVKEEIKINIPKDVFEEGNSKCSLNLKPSECISYTNSKTCNGCSCQIIKE